MDVNGSAQLLAGIPQSEDLNTALDRTVADDERIIIARGGKPVAALIPLIDLSLLLKLEEAELDRLDVEELRQADEDDEQDARIPWEKVKLVSRS